MAPYYEDEAVQIWHGDCREVLPNVGAADLVLTDPPYGIADIWKGGWGHGWDNARAHSIVRNGWDVAPDAETLRLVLSKGRDAVIWGGNYFALPLSRGWLVWAKEERNFSLGEAELAWTTRDSVIRVFNSNRAERDALGLFTAKQHPAQKPVTLMRWCLAFFPDAETVLDPFMGSGTTLRAAKDMGRRAIGIEQREDYCEIAARRMSQMVLPDTSVEGGL